MRVRVGCADATAPESSLQSRRDGVRLVPAPVRDPNHLKQRRVTSIGMRDGRVAARVDRAVHGATALSRFHRGRRLKVDIGEVQLLDAVRVEQFQGGKEAAGEHPIKAQGDLEVLRKPDCAVDEAHRGHRSSAVQAPRRLVAWIEHGHRRTATHEQLLLQPAVAVDVSDPPVRRPAAEQADPAAQHRAVVASGAVRRAHAR